MNGNSPKARTQDIDLQIRMSKELVERIKNHCQKHKISVDDFMLDAVTAKLRATNKERRKRQRL